MSVTRGLGEATGFLTAVGRARVPGPDALAWFGVVGAGIGGAVGGTWWLAAIWLTAPAAAVVALAVDAALTGLLHLDGLSDTADGLLPPLARERRLAVMRDPAAGVFGVVAVVLALLARFAVLASAAPGRGGVLTVAALWAVSRGIAASVATTVPYARAHGLATAFVPAGASGPRRALVIAAGTGPAVLLAALATLASGRALVALAVAAIAATAVVALGRRRIGGFTGDVLGAVIVIAETAGLLVLAVDT